MMCTLEYDASREFTNFFADSAHGMADNHKPDKYSDSSQSYVRLQPLDSDPSSFDLSLSDNSEAYSYLGSRRSDAGQYVLLFDAANKRFVLHQVDSTFDMNLVKAPWEDDASTLRSQYPQLETLTPTKPEAQPTQRRSFKSARSTKTTKAEIKRRKSTEKPRKARPPPQEESPRDDEKFDDGFTIEYPDGPSSSQVYKSQSTPISRRYIAEDMSDEDHKGEESGDERNQDVDHLKLPSPANNAGGISDEDLELDLEAELEEALKEPTGTGAGESDESEEE